MTASAVEEVDVTALHSRQSSDGRIVTATEMDKMTPEQRADVVDIAMVQSCDDVPEPFKSRVLAIASELGASRRQRG